MVVYIKKPKGSEGFHQIVDFLNASHIRTLDNGEIELTAIIDGKVKIVTEASIRRHLQLADSNDISSLPTTKIFEQLSLMGYVSTSNKLTFQKDKAASIGVDVRYGGAATTVTSLETGQGNGNIDKTPTMPHDSPLPRVNTLGSDEGNDLEDPSKQGRKIAKIDQDPAISLVQHDIEIQGTHEHDMEFDFDLDAAKDVSTAEKDVSIAKPVSTAGAVVTTASVAAVSTASPTRRVSIVDDITMAERLVYIRKSATKEKGYTLQKLRGYSFDEIKNLFETTMRRVHTFVPIESEIEREIPELPAGSSKRDAEEELDQETSKRQKTCESSELAEEPRDKEVDELSQEELQQMMIIVLEQGMNVESLQTKEGNRHLHADREGVSIIKRNSYTDAGCKDLGGSR
ncbi:hypothetical protein Tco_0153610 [Tanacetum coccineum]